MYFLVFPIKAHATIAQTPKAMLVNQTYLSAYAYPQRLPIAAAFSISGVTPGTEARAEGSRI
jgi:hypothetical protein